MNQKIQLVWPSLSTSCSTIYAKILTICARIAYIGDQSFLEGKLIVGGASVARVVSHHNPIIMVFGIVQEYCRRLIHPYVVPSINPLYPVDVYTS